MKEDFQWRKSSFGEKTNIRRVNCTPWNTFSSCQQHEWVMWNICCFLQTFNTLFTLLSFISYSRLQCDFIKSEKEFINIENMGRRNYNYQYHNGTLFNESTKDGTTAWKDTLKEIGCYTMKKTIRNFKEFSEKKNL